MSNTNKNNSSASLVDTFSTNGPHTDDNISTSDENSLLKKRNAAPLARLETLEDDSDTREVVTKPYPGVDDGFFTNNEPEKPENSNPDVEKIPLHPKTPETPDKEEPDGRVPGGFYPRFPTYPGFGRPDLEVGSTGDFDGDGIPDVNVYQHKKTLAQGMMDLALFSANANQLRYVLESFTRHPYYYPSLALISISLILQVAVGVGLVWNATYNVKDKKEICLANKINNFTIMGIFLVTVINVFISAFGVADPPTT